MRNYVKTNYAVISLYNRKCIAQLEHIYTLLWSREIPRGCYYIKTTASGLST